MQETVNQLDVLLEKAAIYSKTSYELAKLRALDKSSDLISTIIPQSVVIALAISGLFFLNIGIALYLGEWLNSMYCGFIIVSAAYMVMAIIMRLFFYKPLKRIVGNYIIKTILK